MLFLRQSTASQEIAMGPFVDQTDGFTAEDGLTIAASDIKVWKSGAIVLADKNSGGATHISGGIYYATLDATDTNTLGSLALLVHVAGARPVRLEAVVLAAGVYDSLVAGTAPAEAAGRPTSLVGMLRRVFEWTSNKKTRDRSTGEKLVYGDDGSTELETQTQSTSGTTDTESEGETPS